MLMGSLHMWDFQNTDKLIIDSVELLIICIISNKKCLLLCQETNFMEMPKYTYVLKLKLSNTITKRIK